MTASLSSKVNGTQGALQVNGVDAVVFEAGGIASGYKAGSITPAALNGNQSGSAPALVARAWCVFNGTLAGTNAPIAGGNVSSVTRNATGDYTINFAIAMPDGNYCVTLTCRNSSSASGSSPVMESGSDATKVRVTTYVTSTGASLDPAYVMVAIFR